MKISVQTPAIVTGGASGLGEATARAIAATGAKVAICDLQVERGREVASEIGGVFCEVDVTDDASVDAGFAKARATHGQERILVNCAGVTFPSPFDDTPPEQFERMLRINVLGSVYPTKVVLPSMKARRRGRVVFVASQLGQLGVYGYTAYSASKFALRGLAESLQMETRMYNVGVSLVYPPDTNTPQYAEENKIKPPETFAIAAAGKVFQPEEVAADLVRGVQSGTFSISTGLDGLLLRLGTASFEPCFSVLEAAAQVALSSVLRLAAFFYLWHFYGIVERHSRFREAGDKKQK